MKALGVFSLLSMAAIGTLNASVYTLPEKGSRLLGVANYYQVEEGDYFQAISEYHDVGLLALIAANRGVDPFAPKTGSKLTIPSNMILPYGAVEGIVINLAELRLYYFPPNEKLVYVFPVGIGRQGLSTPITTTKIGEMRKDPVWRPTQEMRDRYFKENGKVLAKEIPPGPNNPFGKYALRLGTSEYLIHGTNQRVGIGLRASSGCIRMYADDIEWLYHNVAKGTQVKVMNQPIKMSYEPDGSKWMEVHSPLQEDAATGNNGLTEQVIAFIGDEAISKNKAKKMLDLATGIPKKL